MTHTKIVAVPATLIRFLFRKHVWICETILVKLICESLKSDENCLNRRQFLVRTLKTAPIELDLSDFDLEYKFEIVRRFPLKWWVNC